MSIVIEPSKHDEFFNLVVEDLSDINPEEIIKSINNVPIDDILVLDKSGETIKYLRSPVLVFNDSYSIYGVKLWSFIFQLSIQYEKSYVASVAQQVLLYLEKINEISRINESAPDQSDEDGEFDIGVSICRALLVDGEFFSRINIDLKINICAQFHQLFKVWDLDHEHPSTTGMMDKVLYVYGSHEFPRFKKEYIDLLAHRLTNGQHRILEGFNYIGIANRAIQMQNLKGGGITIKDILDQVCAKTQEDVHFIYELCIPIYGKREDLIQEIVNYYDAKYNLTNNYGRLIADMNSVGEVVDLHIVKNLSFSPFQRTSEINTGFHTYSVKDRKWNVNKNVILKGGISSYLKKIIH